MTSLTTKIKEFKNLQNEFGNTHQAIGEMIYPVRAALGKLIAPVLKVTGFRFSKSYRHGITQYHRTVYFFIDTVTANIKADS